MSASVNSGARLTFVGHATVLIEIDGLRILTDPVLRDRVGPLRRQGPSIEPDLYRNVDVALVSHAHWDHLDVPSLRRLGSHTRLVVPAGTRRSLRMRRVRNVIELRPQDEIDLGPVRIEATAANHEVVPNLIARDAEAMGFVVHASQSIYFAGDTDIFGAMADLHPSLDAALLPVWGWGPILGPGHLDPGRAAHALRLLKPRLAVPIHWGTLAPIGLDRVRRNDWLHRPASDFKRYAARLAPDVEVRVIQPGDSIDLSWTGRADS